MIEIKVPLILEGTWKNVKALSESLVRNIESSSKSISGHSGSNELLKSLDTGFNRLIAKVGILAAIWGAFDIFIRPILSMFKLIMVLLLMPMMPLLKTMLKSLAEVAEQVKKAQAEAGGTGFDAMMAGFAVMLKSPTIWALIGGLIAAAFVIKLASTALAGVVSFTLAKLGVTAITAMFPAALKAAVVAGAGIAVVGLITFTVAKLLGVDNFGAISTALIAAGAVALGVGGWQLLLVVSVVLASYQFGKKLSEKLKEWQTDIPAIGSDTFLKQYEAAKLAPKKKEIDDLCTGMSILNTKTQTVGIKTMQLSDYLVNNKNEWLNMSKTSNSAINSIITNLNRIPRKIVTIHEIRTIKK